MSVNTYRQPGTNICLDGNATCRQAEKELGNYQHATLSLTAFSSVGRERYLLRNEHLQARGLRADGVRL